MSGLVFEGHRPLVIGEDLSKACLLNAGVMVIQICDWSRTFFDDVWESTLARKYHNRNFHEQSTIIRLLQKGEKDSAAVLQADPFHSFLGGPREKQTDHVCIKPRDAFNTNLGRRRGVDSFRPISFVFHAVGMRKLEAVHEVLVDNQISFRHHRVFESLLEATTGFDTGEVDELCGIRSAAESDRVRYTSQR